MVKLESIVSGKGLKGLLYQDRDMLRELAREVVQQTLEAEMEAALGASKGERTDSRLGYPFVCPPNNTFGGTLLGVRLFSTSRAPPSLPPDFLDEPISNSIYMDK